MRKLPILLTFIFSSVLIFAQTNELPKRNAFNLHIAVNDTSYYNEEIAASSFILPGNTIQLYPGEKVFIEVELIKNEIKSMKSVKENLHPEKTLVISFSQQTEGNMHQGMMLEIENPFDKKLEYKANIFLMNTQKWLITNVWPVRAKISSYESWQDLIITIGLSDWKLN